MSQSWKKVAITLSKLAISILLLAYLISKIDLQNLYETILSVDLYFFSIALIITFFRVILIAFRWQILLSSKNIIVPLLKLIKYYFVASFYNLFLPTTIGGDSYRIVSLSKDIDSKTESFSSVLIERFIGFFALSVISIFSLLFSKQFINNRAVYLFIIILFILFILFIYLYFNKNLVKKGLSVMGKFRFKFLITKLSYMHDVLIGYNKKRVLWKVFIISIVFQIFGVLSVYFTGLSLDLKVGILFYFIFAPISWIIMMAPISISGFGVREGVYIYFFSLINVSKEVAVTLSFLFFALGFFLGVFGGCVNVASLFVNNSKTIDK